MTQSPLSSSVLALWALLAACALAFLAGCRAEPKLTPQQAEGKQVYEEGCAHCHVENDLRLKKVPPDLHDLFAKATLPSGAPATDAQVEHLLIAGKGMMPSFAYQLNGEQIAALLAYLHTGLHDEQNR